MKYQIKHLLLAMFAIALLFAISFRIYHQYVPRRTRHADLFWRCSSKGPRLVSPNGTVYAVYYNDAGAMHSGNHWVWIVGVSDFFGRYTLSEGYLKADHAQIDISPVVQRWEGEIPIIRYSKGRYTGASVDWTKEK